MIKQSNMKMKILIVDDSRMDRHMIIKGLKRNGVENGILEACNGEEGLEILSKNFQDVGLILLDWQMPKMDGMDFMRGVVKVPEVKSIPIVMVTASGSEEAKKCAKRVNPNLVGYIVKPFKQEILFKIISPYLT